MARGFLSWLGFSAATGGADGGAIRHRKAASPEARRRLERIVPSPPRLESTGGDRLEAGPRLAPFASWVCQYQRIDPAALARSDADVMLIDTSPDGSRESRFSLAQVAQMRGRAGEGRRRLVGYMSIGEAEYCRFYWRNAWTRGATRTREAPPWLDEPNDANWEGNWKVRFWDPAWQSLIVDNPDSFLNRIIDQGYDGVLLDVVEAYAYWMDDDRGKEKRPTAAGEMVALVRRIARHARQVRGRPDFLVVPINAERLLVYPDYRATISALCREELLFDQIGPANRKPQVRKRDAKEVEDMLSYLRHATADRIPVLALEYLLDKPEPPATIAAAADELRANGFFPYFSTRDLERLAPVVAPPGAGV